MTDCHEDTRKNGKMEYWNDGMMGAAEDLNFYASFLNPGAPAKRVDICYSVIPVRGGESSNYTYVKAPLGTDFHRYDEFCKNLPSIPTFQCSISLFFLSLCLHG